MAEDTGLLVKIRADADQAEKEIKKFKSDLNALEKEARNSANGFEKLAATSGLTAEQFTSLKAGALAVAAGVTAVVAAASAAGVALFELTKNAAEFGSEIFDASQKTGLSAEALSAMKFAADQSGTSLETVTGAAAKFAKTIGDAANGSKEAQARLDRLGVTSKDLDEALAQALETIVKVTPGTEQMTAAMDAFGRSGAALLPFIKSFDGDLEQLIRTAKELGVTIDDEAARAADEFGDQLDILSAQLAGVGRAIAKELMPEFQKMATDISSWLKENKGTVQSWGETFAYALRRIAAGVLEAKTNWEGFVDVLHLPDKISAEGFTKAMEEYSKRAAARAAVLQRVGNVVAGTNIQGGGGMHGQPDDLAPGALSPPTGPYNYDAGAAAEAAKKAEEEAKRAADKRRREREATAKADLSARISLEEGYIREAEKVYEEALERLREEFKKTGDAATFVKDQTDALASRNSVIQEITESLNKLEFQQLGVWSGPQADALEQKQRERVDRLNEVMKKSVDGVNETIKKYDKDKEKNDKKELERKEDLWDKQAKADADAAIAEQELFETKMRHMEEEEEQFQTFVDSHRVLLNPEKNAEDDEAAKSPFDHLLGSWEKFFEVVNEQMPTLRDMMQEFGQIGQNVMLSMAQAIGSLVQQWVLYGNTAPGAARKALAGILAAVAAEAAVKAIMATAEGFFFLATHKYDSAANAFTAAAFYGTVAAVAAVTGRAIAGNSFNQQTAGGGSQATGASRQGSSTSGGGAYSGEEDTVIEQGINRPAIDVNIKLGLNSDGVIEVLENDAKNNGRFRGLVLRLADA